MRSRAALKVLNVVESQQVKFYVLISLYVCRPNRKSLVTKGQSQLFRHTGFIIEATLFFHTLSHE